MEIVPVASSNISHIGFSAGTLLVQFGSNVSWTYEGVPEEVHRRFMASDSKGKFFYKYIRNKYPGTRKAEDMF